MHCLFCLLVGVGSRPSSWVQLTGAGTFFSLHCSGWSLEDLFGRTVTTQCHLADQSNVWVYQEVSWNVRTAVACIRECGTLVLEDLETLVCIYVRIYSGTSL